MTSKPTQLAPKKEIFAWGMYDFANSGYTTVVLTAVFNSYFVAVVGQNLENGAATFIWTLAIAASNLLVLFSAPIIGAIADYSANKKRFLLTTTAGCVFFTALLSLCGPSDISLAVILIILSSFMFFSGENLISAFLPEISPPDHMGRVSAFGWTLGYIGGLLVLGLCLVYVNYAQAQGKEAAHFVPVTMLIVATAFALAATPTFLWLKERAIAQTSLTPKGYIKIGYQRLHHTLVNARQHRDFFRFLIALTVYTCGINTVIVLAAIYAQEVMGFETQDTITLILVVNVTAAIGAFLFGRLQDSFGSKRTLAITLLIWIGAMLLIYFSSNTTTFWIVANLIGLALGASQSAGRALVGMFAPPSRSGEYYGLWGLATKLAAIIGPVSYGLLTYLSDGDHRMALLCTTLFFIVGLLLLLRVNEKQGREAARVD